MRLVSDILSDTWDKLLRLMITMESNKQVIWMYSTLNRVLRKVWASLIAQGLKKKKKKSTCQCCGFDWEDPWRRK